MNKYLEELRRPTDPGESLPRVEMYLKRLKEVEKETTEPIEKAIEVKIDGEEFIEEDHYAIDCIRPKWAELKNMVEEHRNLIGERRDILERSYELQQRLDKVG